VTDPAATTTLHERFGGQQGVDALVEEFYRRVEADPPLRAVYPEDLGPGKTKLALFLGQWLGGPPAYSERFGHPRLRRRHFPFVIDERAAGRWLKHMRESMQSRGIAAADIAFVFERLAPLAHHMINASDNVPREPLGDVRME
jgi:hemoglobin